MSEIKYAVYPGTVTLQDGVTTKTWTASDLIAAYGVTDRTYIVVNSLADEPKGLDMLNYITLKPRADDNYQDYPEYAQDDDSAVTWGPDFDGTKKYTMEGDPLNLYPDENDEEKLVGIV